MKKALASLMLILMGCFSALAWDGFKITGGSIAPLKEGGTATVSINMADCQFDNKMPLREDSRFADVDKNIPEFESEFVREYNEHTKKFRMVKSGDADYRFIINVTNLDVFVNLFSFKGGVGTKIWGTMIILDKEGNQVAEITLKEFESSGMTYAISLEETFEVFAKDFAKRVNKGK